MTYINNFNYLEYLRRHGFVGALNPAQGDIEPIIGLLVPIEIAIGEIQLWSGQEVTRPEFVKYLKQNNVFAGDIDQFEKLRERLKTQTKEQRLERTTNNAKLKEIADILDVSYSRIHGGKLSGRTGHVSADGMVLADGRSKRHLSGIARRLSFLDRTDTGFKLDRPLTAKEAETVRSVLGLKKRPSLTAAEKTDRPIVKMAA